jgi:putative DNA primase/helicase
MLKYALEYAERGLYVFPIASGEKKPPKVPWREYSSNDSGQIKQWWSQWPSANIGIDCEKSRLTVADLDIEPDCDGRETWRDLCQKHDNTITSITGSGGQHILFRTPDGVEIRNSARKLGLGVDVRANGGYIVAPPSIHPNGKRYEWELSNDFETSDFLPLPGPLIELLRNGNGDGTNLPRQLPDVIPEGERESRMCQMAGSMRRWGATPEEIKDALTVLNKRCDPPLLESDLERIANSIGSKPPEIEPSDKINSLREITDLGNAKTLNDLYENKLKWCFNLDEWYIWNGKQWVKDDADQIRRYADNTLKAIVDYANNHLSGDDKTKAIKKALECQSHYRLNGMLAEAKPLLPISIEAFDTDPWKFNCLNGTVDLKTGSLLPHNRSDLISKIAPIKYDPSASCDKWDSFLNDIQLGNKEKIWFLQKAIGYSLTGLTSEQGLFILQGCGENGKSTLIKTILNIMGSYAQHTPTETFLTKKDDPVRNDIARLPGARFVSAVEAEQGRRLAESLIKQLTGGDRVSARFLHKELFDFDPQFKIFLSVNHRPVIRGTDHAIWRRIHLIEFDYMVPENKQIKDLEKILFEEASGILNWAITGCLGWQQEGLNPPEEVIQATKGYRQEMDVLGSFLDDCCEIKETETVIFSDLYNAYKNWCEKSGEKYTLTKKAMGTALKERGFFSRKQRTSQGTPLVYEGIKLVDPVQEKFEKTQYYG